MDALKWIYNIFGIDQSSTSAIQPSCPSASPHAGSLYDFPLNLCPHDFPPVRDIAQSLEAV